MISLSTLLLTLLLFLTALLYAAVGLGGGTGYLAVMGLAGMAPEVMRPTALALNILVAGIGTWTHLRAGQLPARLFWPLALASVPFAFLGGRLDVAEIWYWPLVALVLLFAAGRLWQTTGSQAQALAARRLPLWMVGLMGAGIGLFSGVVGLGGGIFLGPLLLLTGAADTRKTMGVTAAFVLVNSVAALLGRVSTMQALPPEIPLWLLAAGVGGWLGARFGSQRMDPLVLRRLLALVLLFAGVRMLWSWITLFR